MRPQSAAPSAPSAREVELLTSRQREVLELLGDGKDAGEIAATLGVTIATVRTHIRHILRALGVHTQLAAVVRACPRGS